MDTAKFSTERLLARSWRIDDLQFAMRLWGDPAVTALIDSRGQLTPPQRSLPPMRSAAGCSTMGEPGSIVH